MLLLVVTDHKVLPLKDCPKPEILTPCVCVTDDYPKWETTLICGGEENYDMKQIFVNISHQLEGEVKNFTKFYFNNTVITEFKENTTFDIIFEEIFFHSALNLTAIHSNAFSETKSSLINFYISYTPVSSIAPNHDIFQMLNQMTNIEDIRLITTDLKEIPSNAFTTLNNLTTISFWNSSINKIGNYAFQELVSVTDIQLGHNLIGSYSCACIQF